MTTPRTTAARAETAEPPRLPTFSVRTRITVGVGVLVALALGGAGLIVYALGSASVDERVGAAIDQEMAEFAAFQESARPPYGDSRSLVLGFLGNNVGTSSEMLVGYWEGEVQRRSVSDRGELFEDPLFRGAVDELAASGGVRRLETEWGTVHVDVQPIADGGAFAVAYFVDDELVPLNRTMRTYAVAATLALILVTSVAARQAGRLLRPVRVLRETAEEIEETDLSMRIPETGNDDITDLTRTVNAMLARLEHAFAGQRAFLDDAGHELRTPLTIVRGHLELVAVDDPREVARTRDLVLDEVDRMARLVDDLILLTKADRPDFFELAPVSVGGLVDRVLEKCRALGHREWLVDARAEVVVPLDEQRITQALVQLAQNAVKHTGRGDTIALGSGISGDRVRLWVRDTGPGVADEHKALIFQRFGRGEVPEGDAGFGLGLSIVRAIAEGHGGYVDVRDEVPSGACFVVDLPVRRSAAWPAS